MPYTWEWTECLTHGSGLNVLYMGVDTMPYIWELIECLIHGSGLNALYIGIY